MMRCPIDTPPIRQGLLRRVLACAVVSLIVGCPVFAEELRRSPPSTLSKGFKFDAQDGKALYQTVCQGCHMPAGQGAKGAGMYPALANNPKVASAAYVIGNVLNGRNGMPGLGIFLNDAQVVSLVTYVRTNMGNNFADAVTPQDVAALRRPAKGIFDE